MEYIQMKPLLQRGFLERILHGVGRRQSGQIVNHVVRPICFDYLDNWILLLESIYLQMTRFIDL